MTFVVDTTVPQIPRRDASQLIKLALGSYATRERGGAYAVLSYIRRAYQFHQEACGDSAGTGSGGRAGLEVDVGGAGSHAVTVVG